MQVKNRDHQVLEKIVRYCGEIEAAHQEYHKSYERFCTNSTYRNAVALCLLQIGELTNKLSDDFKAAHPQIPWRAIRGMRNVVAHEYGSIDVETVWETAENGTTELKDFCEQMLLAPEAEGFDEIF